MTTDTIFHRVITDNWPQISHGKDCYLYAEDGRAYLDACAGVHVVSIGHGVPEIAAAMQEQADKVCFTYARFLTQPQLDLADKIATMTPGDLNRVFFVSGGSEATEAGLKIARKYHIETGHPKKYKVITRWQSWHGNTIGALSMSGRSTWREDYVPYLLDFPHITFPNPDHCPYCKDQSACTLSCAEELERVIVQEGSEYIAAFIAEPISGTSCCGLMPPPDYFPTLREICDRHNILMIIDEVVTGFGRTGVNFGIEHWQGVVPDIMATGKGLSSGYTPIAATIVRDEIYDGIYKEQNHYVHGHTYGGNPLSCAIALAVQNYIEDNDLIARCARMGDLMHERLKPLEASPIVGAVRGGQGLLNGVEFVKDKAIREPFDPQQGVTGAVVNRAFEKSVLIMPGSPGMIDGVNGDHIAISPPFTINEEQVEEIAQVIADVVGDMEKELGY
jgi:adenosylmethionine-8-amino-7-oxononanoate aminotransferase